MYVKFATIKNNFINSVTHSNCSFWCRTLENALKASRVDLQLTSKHVQKPGCRNRNQRKLDKPVTTAATCRLPVTASLAPNEKDSKLVRSLAAEHSLTDFSEHYTAIAAARPSHAGSSHRSALPDLRCRACCSSQVHFEVKIAPNGCFSRPLRPFFLPACVFRGSVALRRSAEKL